MAEASSTGMDVKPKMEQGEDDGTLAIRVKDQAQGEIVFKVKRTTKFKRVLQAFCDRKGWNIEQVRFAFDGQRVDPEMAPEELGMESNDCIDAFLEQIGGH